MNIKKIALLLALAAPFSHALNVPTPSEYDQRMQTVVYNPDDVVKVITRIGRTTMIRLEPDERLAGDSSGLSIGDAKAWSPAVRGNNIFLKPAAERPDTNMIVTTNKRVYVFSLFTAKKTKKTTQATSYVVKFIYPDTAQKLAEAEQKKAEAVAQKAAELKQAEKAVNEKYFMRGDTILAPTAAWDNGRFTYFRYATSRDVPVIYKILSDGKEALTNMHVEDDTLVVHETAAKFVLRLGDSVLGIENDGYTPDGVFNAAGTTVDNTVRLERN